MDLTSKNMYETFKDGIWKELGPLDPDWFDVLTSQTFPDEGNNSDQDELCANQETKFKTPLEAAAVESQLFSTPKVFRHNQAVTPEAEDDQSFTNKQEKENLPWTETSPYLFGTSKEGVHDSKYNGLQPQREDSFDLLQTPQKPSVNYAQQISESLGAQIHPDISWTSSLNTPPAVPSTLILTNTDASPCPVSITADKNVVIVRKLFPFLSNASRTGASSPKNNRVPVIQQGLVSPVADKNPEPQDSPSTSLNQSEGVWRQKLPDAIEDKDVRSTVADVLDGAENVLSIFFTNTSSALRKVKTERNKRKQNIQTKEKDGSATDKSLTNNNTFTEFKTDDQECDTFFLCPMGKTVVGGNTQWSPLSLSEIPPYTIDNLCQGSTPAAKLENKILTEKLPIEAGHLARPLLTITDSGLTKKKRKFVYTVETVQGKEMHSQKTLSPRSPKMGYSMSVKQLGIVQDEADCCRTREKENQKMETIAKDSLPPSLHLKVQDLDMSQLCRDFAEDFTQMPELSKLSKVAEDPPQNQFSPSACLSAMKRAKIKLMQTNPHQNCEGISSRRNLSATNTNLSSNRATVNDSGFLSTVTDITHITTTSFALSSSENASQSQPDFKAYTHRTSTNSRTNKGTGNTHSDYNLQETDANQFSPMKESHMPDSGTESGFYKESMSTQPPWSQVGACLQEKTIEFLPSISAAGFKTASNKGIEISSANLERARCLFEEIESERYFIDKAKEIAHDSEDVVRVNHGSVKCKTSKSNPQISSRELRRNVSGQLTASQKADVTELCTLLEESNSQFEFTQFKAAPNGEHNATPYQIVEKELDPYFLTGINFDDSFTSDVEKHTATTVMPDKFTSVSDGKKNCETSRMTGASIAMSKAVKKDNPSTEDVSSLFNDDFEGSRNVTSSEPETLARVDDRELNHQGNKKPLLGVGFKTAGGNVLRVSEKCLNKARALFADLDENPKDQNLSYKQCEEIDDKTETGQITSVTYKDGAKDLKNSNIDTSTCQGGFQMASGKEISVSAKALQEADDCNALDCDPGVSGKHNRSVEPLPESAHQKEGFPELKNVQQIKENFSEEPVIEGKNINVRPKVNLKIPGLKNSSPLINADTLGKQSLTENAFSSFSQTASKDISSFTVSELKNDCEFSTVNGKKFSVSADSVEKAESLLNEMQALGETTKQVKVDGDALWTENVNLIQQSTSNGGFQTASGKGVVISSAALKKAKSLLSACEDVDNNIHLNTTSSMIQVHGPPQKNCGFVAANGKPVTLSSDALQKAKALFSDIDLSAENLAVSVKRDSGKCQDNSGFSKFISGGGFCTASGKKVFVSNDALREAKSQLSESIEFEDTNKKWKHCEDTLPPQNYGFRKANSKEVAVSSVALKKAKNLLSECSNSSGESCVNSKNISGNSGASLAVLDTKNSDNTHDNSGKMHCGFMTAGGSKVLVSQRSLLNAKNMFKEADEGLIATKTSKQDTNEVLGIACAESENVHVVPVLNESALHLDPMEISKGIFKNTSDSTNFPSLHQNPHLMGKTAFNQVSTAPKNINSCAFYEFSSAAGFTVEKKVCMSDDAMTKATGLLNYSTTSGDINKKDTLPTHKSGFQTASGKGVAISSAALKKAKTLLSECEADSKKFQKQFSDPPPKNRGFNRSSDQPESLSSNIPKVSETITPSDRYGALQNGAPVMHFGFTTGGGAKVNVSKKSLMKAKNLWKGFDDGDWRDLNSHSTSPYDTHKSEPAKLQEIKRSSNFRLNSVCDIFDKKSDHRVRSPETGHKLETPRILESSVHCPISMKDKETTTLVDFNEGKTTTSAVDNWQDIPVKELCVLDNEANQDILNEKTNFKRMEQSSFTFQALNLSECTETQQKSVAQEALDCTRALLEDEGLADQNISETLEIVALQGNPSSSTISVEEQKRSGKRSVEDTDRTGQPPMKRRLLEEFDRTVSSPRHSTPHPEKSCPNGVINDRRVFRYSDSLHPNIIKPHRNGKNSVETQLQDTLPTQNSTPGDTRSACSKIPAFVPPFHKKAKTQTVKSSVLSDTRRTPGFIPPFKKQRTVVQEDSCKAQEEDLQLHSSLTPSKRKTYVPPTKKTHNTKQLINIGQDDTQTEVLADSANDNWMTNHNLPVGCKSEGTVGVEDATSKAEDTFQNLENAELARDMQDMRIRKKKRQTIRPLPGSLFLTKTSGLSRISLKATAHGKPPTRYSQKQLYEYGVQQHVTEITSETAEGFRFNLQHFLNREAFFDCGGVKLADGGWLITSNDGTAGKEEFYRALCDTPGVDPKLISEGWVYNHYRWIVWKQASMEMSFPETMGSLCLTPEQVLLQLKYRYDVEVDHSRRPALRKIMERDDTAAKTLILCICGVVSRGQIQNPNSQSDAKTPQGADAKGKQVENPSAVIWLTDGWYAIKAQLDEPLTAMLHKGRLSIGWKLIIHGAQLVGSQDACSPLEAPESLMLKICANSSRRARWDTKLGFYRDPRPFLLPLSCLYSNGGPVGCVDIIILRSYPIQWMERKSDGGVVFRSVRAEEKEARRYNSHKHKAMEILFARIQEEFEKEEKGNDKSQCRRRTLSRQDIASLQDGEELYEAVGDDPAYLEAHLSEQQLEILSTYRRSLIEKKQAALQDRYRRALEAEDTEGSCIKRDITPVWRLCVADSVDQPGKVYQLNLWRPSSDLQYLLKEGCRYKVFNLSTSDGKKRGGIEWIQLTGTNKTQFQDLQYSQEQLSARFQPRVSTSFVELQNTKFQPVCGEVDLTGCVINIIDAQGSCPAFYLVDGKLNFVKVRCFSSLSQSGLEDLVKPHVVLALSNLQLRGQSTFPTPVVYAGDLTVFSTNPKEVHLQDSLRELRNVIQGYENFYLAAEEKLSHLIKSDGLSTVSSPVLQLKSPAYVTERRQDTKTNALSQQPVRSLGSFTPVSKKLPTAHSSTEKDPRSLKRRRALDYLSRIASPPGLSFLSSTASPCVNKTFNPPRRSGTPSTLKAAQNPACKPVNSAVEDEWVNDEELAMIDTQALRFGSGDT